MPASSNPDILQTKQHFELLDGLRGIAAIAVVVYHFMEFAAPDYHDSFIAHGHLAVDFFFCLSGFVIAYAYGQQRMAKLGFWQFFKLRLIRLHPLVIFGSVLGILTFVFDPFSNLHEAFSIEKKTLMFVASCLMVPFASVQERYFNFFHLNPPTWSLFWEYVANLGYALFLFRFTNKWLWFLLGIAMVLLGYEASRSASLSVGWGDHNFWGGGIRVFYSFLAGILVYRLNWKIKSRLGFIFISLMLLATFLIPHNELTNRFVDPIVVILYFPFLIALGAGASLSKVYQKSCRFLGEISYPLYMVHYPILWILFSYIQKFKPDVTLFYWLIPVGTLLLIAFAYAVLRFYDAPVRAYFGKRLKKRNLNQNQ